MARDRDWVDYANLAANVVQTAQLGGINGKMQELAELTRQTEYREQERAAEEHRETILRDAVFQADTLLLSLRKISTQNPRAAMAWAKHALLQFERNGVTSASFRSYEDKERLRSATGGHEQIVQQCATGLSPQQQDQAERCGQYLAERDDLTLLIQLSSKQEEQSRLLTQLKEIDDEIKSRQGLESGLRFGGLGGCLIGWVILASEGKSNMLGIILLVLGGGSLAASIPVLWRLRWRKCEVEEQVAQLVKDEPLLAPSCGVLGRLRSTFGNANNADLLVMQRDREALIAEVLDIPMQDAGGS